MYHFTKYVPILQIGFKNHFFLQFHDQLHSKLYNSDLLICFRFFFRQKQSNFENSEFVVSESLNIQFLKDIFLVSDYNKQGTNFSKSRQIRSSSNM